MVFLSGPRQVGKTTICREIVAASKYSHYLNWDIPADRRVLLEGADKIAEVAGLNQVRDATTLLAMDELHKFDGWKDALKGLFDGYGEETNILVTGSGNLQTFNSGGDSLMGRYFAFRMHPLSPREWVDPIVPGLDLLRTPVKCDEWDQLLKFGGYPEPLLKAEDTFHRRWARLRSTQLVREDVRNLTDIKDLDRLEILVELIREQAGQLMNFSSLSRDLQVSVDTITRWLGTLRAMFYCFEVTPWHKNLSRALRKQPKYYLWDWSGLKDPGARNENFVASTLLKAVHAWTDLGYGDFQLHFIRDKEQNEVDFLVSRDGVPWFLAEVKTKSTRLSPALLKYHGLLATKHAFQLNVDAEFVERDCFTLKTPKILPAKTFLSQLV
jgi:predicted AAA+ superfamily ATPase